MCSFGQTGFRAMSQTLTKIAIDGRYRVIVPGYWATVLSRVSFAADMLLVLSKREYLKNKKKPFIDSTAFKRLIALYMKDSAVESEFAFNEESDDEYEGGDCLSSEDEYERAKQFGTE